MKLLSFILYRSFAIYLPKSSAPYIGKYCKFLRSWLASQMFEKTGKNINIEKGAKFGFGKQIVIGNNSGIGVNASIPPDTVIGNDVMMGPDCVIYASNHKFSNLNVPMNRQGHEQPKQTVIGDDVWIGGRVTIMPGKTIGNGSIIAAGSVVTQNIEDYGIYGGNPARFIKSRRE